MKTINPAGVWGPRGRGFSMGVIQPVGHVIHFTGQVAWDENEVIVGNGDVAEQTRQCFRNIETVLQAVGGTMADIVSITTYFTDRKQLPLIQSVRLEFLQADHEPASTSVMVAGLGHEDFLVELAPIAVVPRDRFREPTELKLIVPAAAQRKTGTCITPSPNLSP
ncbi:RidA family protein [Rhodospirillales bacterium]|nr:RidA family protein [Rhodospirillales bacterium]